jgi:hypothetical protein
MLKSPGISGHSPCTERNSWIAETGAASLAVILTNICWFWGYGADRWCARGDLETLDEEGGLSSSA